MVQLACPKLLDGAQSPPAFKDALRNHAVKHAALHGWQPKLRARSLHDFELAEGLMDRRAPETGLIRQEIIGAKAPVVLNSFPRQINNRDKALFAAFAQNTQPLRQCIAPSVKAPEMRRPHP